MAATIINIIYSIGNNIVEQEYKNIFLYFLNYMYMYILFIHITWYNT